MSNESLSRSKINPINTGFLTLNYTLDARPSYIHNSVPFFNLVQPDRVRYTGILKNIPSDFVSLDNLYKMIVRKIHKHDDRSPIAYLEERLSRGDVFYVLLDRHNPQKNTISGKFQQYFVNIPTTEFNEDHQEVLNRVVLAKVSKIGSNHKHVMAESLEVLSVLESRALPQSILSRINPNQT